METIAFKSGLKAAQMGIALEDSALNNLHPDSERYEQFIAGYDSYSEPNKASKQTQNVER
ncbi:hypothetical protein [Vibrio sp. R78045]|uniref:hypothetical protein n=1 Tax=Vibrio sp. R78045 TaxID=3093868 RepID=UPI0036F2B6EA